MGRRHRLRRHLLRLHISLAFMALTLFASILVLRESQRNRAQIQDLHLARATCQSLYYAIQQAETVRYEGQGPTCTLTLDDGRTLSARWRQQWWEWEKRL